MRAPLSAFLFLCLVQGIFSLSVPLNNGGTERLPFYVEHEDTKDDKPLESVEEKLPTNQPNLVTEASPIAEPIDDETISNAENKLILGLKTLFNAWFGQSMESTQNASITPDQTGQYNKLTRVPRGAAIYDDPSSSEEEASPFSDHHDLNYMSKLMNFLGVPDNKLAMHSKDGDKHSYPSSPFVKKYFYVNNMQYNIAPNNCRESIVSLPVVASGHNPGPMVFDVRNSNNLNNDCCKEPNEHSGKNDKKGHDKPSEQENHAVDDNVYVDPQDAADDVPPVADNVNGNDEPEPTNDPKQIPIEQDNNPQNTEVKYPDTPTSNEHTDPQSESNPEVSPSQSNEDENKPETPKDEHEEKPIHDLTPNTPNQGEPEPPATNDQEGNNLSTAETNPDTNVPEQSPLNQENEKDDPDKTSMADSVPLEDDQVVGKESEPTLNSDDDPVSNPDITPNDNISTPIDPIRKDLPTEKEPQTEGEEQTKDDLPLEEDTQPDNETPELPPKESDSTDPPKEGDSIKAENENVGPTNPEENQPEHPTDNSFVDNESDPATNPESQNVADPDTTPNDDILESNDPAVILPSTHDKPETPNDHEEHPKDDDPTNEDILPSDGTPETNEQPKDDAPTYEGNQPSHGTPETNEQPKDDVPTNKDNQPSNGTPETNEQPKDDIPTNKDNQPSNGTPETNEQPKDDAPTIEDNQPSNETPESNEQPPESDSTDSPKIDDENVDPVGTDTKPEPPAVDSLIGNEATDVLKPIDPIVKDVLPSTDDEPKTRDHGEQSNNEDNQTLDKHVDPILTEESHPEPPVDDSMDPDEFEPASHLDDKPEPKSDKPSSGVNSDNDTEDPSKEEPNLGDLPGSPEINSPIEESQPKHTDPDQPSKDQDANVKDPDPKTDSNPDTTSTDLTPDPNPNEGDNISSIQDGPNGKDDSDSPSTDNENDNGTPDINYQKNTPTDEKKEDTADPQVTEENDPLDSIAEPNPPVVQNPLTPELNTTLSNPVLENPEISTPNVDPTAPITQEVPKETSGTNPINEQDTGPTNVPKTLTDPAAADSSKTSSPPLEKLPEGNNMSPETGPTPPSMSSNTPHNVNEPNANTKEAPFPALPGETNATPPSISTPQDPIKLNPVDKPNNSTLLEETNDANPVDTKPDNGNPIVNNTDILPGQSVVPLINNAQNETSNNPLAILGNPQGIVPQQPFYTFGGPQTLVPYNMVSGSSIMYASPMPLPYSPTAASPPSKKPLVLSYVPSTTPPTYFYGNPIQNFQQNYMTLSSILPYGDSQNPTASAIHTASGMTLNPYHHSSALQIFTTNPPPSNMVYVPTSPFEVQPPGAYPPNPSLPTVPKPLNAFTLLSSLPKGGIPAATQNKPAK